MLFRGHHEFEGVDLYTILPGIAFIGPCTGVDRYVAIDIGCRLNSFGLAPIANALTDAALVHSSLRGVTVNSDIARSQVSEARPGSPQPISG